MAPTPTADPAATTPPEGIGLLKKLWWWMCGLDIARHILGIGVAIAYPHLQMQLLQQAGGLPESATKGLGPASIELAVVLAAIFSGVFLIGFTCLIAWAGMSLIAKKSATNPLVRMIAIGAAGYFALRIIILYVPQENATLATLAPDWFGLGDGALQILAGVAGALCLYLFSAGPTGAWISGRQPQPKG